jgi:hypothetical protein
MHKLFGRMRQRQRQQQRAWAVVVAGVSRCNWSSMNGVETKFGGPHLGISGKPRVGRGCPLRAAQSSGATASPHLTSLLAYSRWMFPSSQDIRRTKGSRLYINRAAQSFQTDHESIGDLTLDQFVLAIRSGVQRRCMAAPIFCPNNSRARPVDTIRSLCSY